MAVVASATGAAVFGLSGVAAGLAGGALLGAGIGGLYSAFTGDGDILNSMLTGGLIGGAAGGLGAALAPAAVTAPSTLAAAPLSTAAVPTTNVLTPIAAQTVAGTGASTTAGAALANAAADPILAASNLSGMTAADIAAASVPAKTAVTAGLTGGQMLGYGLAGTAGMQLLGGRGKGAQAPASAGDPGMIRPFEYSSNPTAATGTYPSPYLTTSYDAAGNPNMDTRERNYFDQGYTAYQPYSAKIGTVNPNIPLPKNIPVSAANGGIMGEYDDEAGNDNVGLSQGNMQKGLSGLGYAHGGIPRYADRGMVDEEAELRKTVMNNLKRLSPEQMKNVMGSFQQEGELEKQFLMKNMPNYAEAMKPSISSMVEGAQYGDRMAQSFGQQPRDVNVMPRVQDLNNYGGIASIGQQVDPNTRVNMMADLQRTPYDQNALESVRRVGAGVDRRIGKDANLSAYYEQDPMGRNKAGGVRYTQQFADGGLSAAGYAGYGQPEEQDARPKNPIAEYLLDQVFNKPASPSANVIGGGNTAGSAAQPSSAPPNQQAETNPILRAMYDKQVENPDYQFTQPELVSGYQAYNPNAFAYDPTARKYSAATPNEQQLNSFKQQMADYMAQDRARKEKEKEAAQPPAYEGGGGGANGGLMPYNLGGYSDGGRLLRGPGDGVSDSIPATIAGKQPARLADGEFVIPARIVSEIGNGSTDAGAKRLYAMMDRIQAGRKKTIGKKNVAKDTKAKKHLIA
jgi:hypothetical protein